MEITRSSHVKTLHGTRANVRSGGGLARRNILGHIDVALLRVAGLVALLLVVANRTLDRILGKHRAVKLDGRKRELLGNFGVLNRTGLLEGKALYALRHITRAGNGRATAERLETDVLNDALVVHLDGEFHHITTSRGTDKTNTDVLVSLQERSDLQC